MLATQYIRILLCTLITMCVPYYAEENLDDQLIEAIRNNDLSKCKTLISQGANVNAKEIRFQWTPLHWAASEDHLEMTELLVENGADINATNIDGETPVKLASDPRVTEFLINYPIFSSFSSAIEDGDLNLCRELITNNPVHVHDLNATILQLLGFDHTKLTFRHQGRDYRLTDVHGDVMHDILL